MCLTIQGDPEKMAQSLRHHIFATVCQRVMQFSRECPEINCLHDKGQHLNAVVKYSLFFAVLASELFQNKINRSIFLRNLWKKQSLRQNKFPELTEMVLHHENEQLTIVVWTTVQSHHRLALDWWCPSNCSRLASDGQCFLIFWQYPNAAEPPK